MAPPPPASEARGHLAEQKGLPAGLSVRELFWSEEECRSIERDINGIKLLADAGRLKSGTVDRTPLRSKYFFGYGYTYGAQVSGKGQEQLLPPDYVDPIPDWVHSKLITRLEDEAIVPKGWINSAVVNDYSPGGMIVSHIDPKQLFARPICIATFFAEGRLVFGVQFAFADRRFSAETSSAPKFVAAMPRGSLTLMDGFSADGITHGIRPEDFDGRRVSVVLRHVFPSAPTMSDPSAVLKPAQRGAPAAAARRVGPPLPPAPSADVSAAAGPGSAAMAPADERRAFGGEAKRTLEFELCDDDDDEPAAKRSRSSPLPGAGSRASSMEMLRRVQGVYSDENSGNVYEVSAQGLVRVTFAPRAFAGAMPSTTWKVEPDGEGRLVCGKGLLTSAGIRSDRLVWTRRDGGGADLVWLRVDGDAAARVGASHLAEGGQEQDDAFSLGAGDAGLFGPGPGAAPLVSGLGGCGGAAQACDALLGSPAALVQGLAPKAAGAAPGLPGVQGLAGGLPRGLLGAVRGPLPAAVSGMSPGGPGAVAPMRPGSIAGTGSSPAGPSAGLRPLRGPTSIIRPSASVGSLTAIGPGRPGSHHSSGAGGNPHPASNRLAQAAGPFAAARGLRAAFGTKESAPGMQEGRLPPGWKRPEGPKASYGNGHRPEPEQAAQGSLPRRPGLVLPAAGVEDGQPAGAQRKWRYKDAHGQVQGPFASSVMSEWSRQGFFPESTLVKAEDEEAFAELGNGMRLLTAALED